MAGGTYVAARAWQMSRQSRMSAHSIFWRRATWGVATWAAFLLVGWVGACGKTSQSAANLADSSSGGAGSVGTDAGTGTGGAMGTGGVTGDAGMGVACSDDGGVSFAAIARPCTQDSDCTIRIAAKCCGADEALGVLRTAENKGAS